MWQEWDPDDVLNNDNAYSGGGSASESGGGDGSEVTAGEDGGDLQIEQVRKKKTRIFLFYLPLPYYLPNTLTVIIIVQQFNNGRDSVLFLIDAHKFMFADKVYEAQIEPFFYAIKSVADMYCDKVMTSDNDLVGTVLYGTNEKKNQFDFENVYILHDLDNPEANRIKELEQIVANGKDEFTQTYGHAKAKCNLHEALWTCQHLFSHVYVTSMSPSNFQVT